MLSNANAKKPKETERREILGPSFRRKVSTRAAAAYGWQLITNTE